jgi:hypothetical protein
MGGSMKNRRSFLKMLGFGAVAAPAMAEMVAEAETIPAIQINDGPWVLLGSQDDITYGSRIWLEWARAAVKANKSELTGA